MSLRDEMLELFDCTRVEERFSLTSKMLITISLAAMQNANVYIFAENDLHVYVRLFKSWGLNVHRVVCPRPKEFQNVDDVEIVSPESLLTDTTPRKFFFVDVSDAAMTTSVHFFNENISSLEFSSAYPIDPEEKARLVHNSPEFDTNSAFYYQSHKRELMELFDSLADETSKQALFHYVESYVKNCVYRGEQNPTRWKYFFGSKYERLYKHLDGEVWINCGANVGDTVFQYLSFDFKPKKILAFEGDTEFYSSMLSNLTLLPQDKRALVEPINKMIDETTDFEKILRGDKCTLINADIEGTELPFLHATEKIIRSDRPVIAICVYHFKEDLLAVPQFIQSICDDYVYYLRKYTSWLHLQKQNHELVFYAVPKERALR
ncbi:MAG: hypothetical protein IJ685_02785 [Selenomonadaceae bacterium]|nr:hypothetical protein [Selenomonadaceae bacterium]